MTEEIQTNLKALNIHQRMHGVMSQLDNVKKGDKLVNNQYKFTSHDQVAEAIHPLLVEYGITAVPSVIQWKQDGNRTEMLIRTKFTNIDNPSDFIECDMLGYGVDGSDKGPGKGISYAFKYALLKAFVLKTGDDPDQDQNNKHKPKASDEENIKYPKQLVLDKDGVKEMVQHGEPVVTEEQAKELQSLFALCPPAFQDNTWKYLNENQMSGYRQIKASSYLGLKNALLKNQVKK